MLSSNPKHGILTVLLLAAAAGGLVAILQQAGALDGLEQRTLDARFRLLARPDRVSPDVVLAAIDEASLAALKRHHVTWKWPRDLYAALVRYLHRGGARVIVFDLLFPDPDTDRLGTDAEETDGALARAMLEAGNVVLAAQLRDREALLARDNPRVRPSPFSLSPASSKPLFERFTGAILPLPLLQESAAALGAVNYTEDATDGICRSIPLVAYLGDELFPHLGLAAFLLARGATTIERLPAGNLRAAGRDVPLETGGRFRVFWYGRGGPGGCFSYYPVAALLASAADEEAGREAALPGSTFRDKIVIVGASATGLFDFRSTPFTGLEPYPAMEIHATVLSNLLQGDFLIRVPRHMVLGALFLLSLAVCGSFLFIRRVDAAAMTTAVCGLGWLAASLALFRWYDRWLDLAAPGLVLAVSFALAAAVSYRLEGRERRRIRALFSRYVSPHVVAEVLERPEDLCLGGKEVVATILFSDIRDFTAISEQLPPPSLVEMLNAHFAVVTDRIVEHRGLLDKYIGDSVMAVFGALLPGTPHAAQACAAALEIQEALGRAQRTSAARHPPLVTRIGLHTGPVVAGNIGSPLRMQYTAVGDAVNLASRLEGANKFYGTRILVSEAAVQAAGGGFVVRELDRLLLKGKRTAVLCFELLGKEGDVPGETLRLLDLFSDGLGWYNDRRYDKALTVFERLLASFPDDPPSRVYRDRCRRLLADPPPPEWDGTQQI